jgi:hypothetical protein
VNGRDEQTQQRAFLFQGFDRLALIGEPATNSY